MMLKKEREVIFLLEKHLDEIKEWLKISSEALSYYLSDDLEKINYLLLRKNEISTSLEDERQEIWDRLCNGAYFPVIRGDLLGIVKSVGRIADAATLSCETFSYLQPEIPIKIKNQLATMVRMVFFLFRPIHESVLYYLRGDDVLKVIRKNVDEFLVKRAEVNVLARQFEKSNIFFRSRSLAKITPKRLHAKYFEHFFAGHRNQRPNSADHGEDCLLINDLLILYEMIVTEVVVEKSEHRI
jgi:uncharacterized protein Yka (UPF0111/DUF47 family)